MPFYLISQKQNASISKLFTANYKLTFSGHFKKKTVILENRRNKGHRKKTCHHQSPPWYFVNKRKIN